MQYVVVNGEPGDSEGLELKRETEKKFEKGIKVEKLKRFENLKNLIDLLLDGVSEMPEPMETTLELSDEEGSDVCALAASVEEGTTEADSAVAMGDSEAAADETDGATLEADAEETNSEEIPRTDDWVEDGADSTCEETEGGAMDSARGSELNETLDKTVVDEGVAARDS